MFLPNATDSLLLSAVFPAPVPYAHPLLALHDPKGARMAPFIFSVGPQCHFLCHCWSSLAPWSHCMPVCMLSPTPLPLLCVHSADVLFLVQHQKLICRSCVLLCVSADSMTRQENHISRLNSRRLCSCPTLRKYMPVVMQPILSRNCFGCCGSGAEELTTKKPMCFGFIKDRRDLTIKLMYLTQFLTSISTEE